jgi:hypothetical protein
MNTKTSVILGALSLIMILGCASNAFAQDYKMAGCGLGSMLIKDDGFIQVFAVTTNNTFANQTFGITFGTSNCTKSGVVRVDREQEAFVEANLDNLSRDMVSGGGEYLMAFSQLLGCSEQGAAIGDFTQARYASLFPNEGANAQQVLYSLKIQMSQEEQFAQSCTRL